MKEDKQASRLPKEYWEQMLPKKLPAPSSSPSKGTNSVTISTSKAVKTDRSLPSSDGNLLPIEGSLRQKAYPYSKMFNGSEGSELRRQSSGITDIDQISRL
ncbi:hypothetical protein QQP08_022502 [Theobroma cacao]|nr:hypothetical protein QQP08_022502 [Theobroma cacao]